MLILGSAGKGYCLQGYNLSLSFPVVCVRHLMTTRMMRKQSEGSQFGTPSLLSDSLAWRFLWAWWRTYSRCRLLICFRIVTGLNDGILCTPFAVLYSTECCPAWWVMPFWWMVGTFVGRPEKVMIECWHKTVWVQSINRSIRCTKGPITQKKSTST